MANCVKCGSELNISDFSVISRNDDCDSCGADVRACIFCKFYDESKHNECSEPSADRVVDKEKANFCDYYHFGNLSGASGSLDEKKEALKKLDDLFK